MHPQVLPQRIADRDKFPNAVREKLKTANPNEKKFQVTVLDMIVEVKAFRLADWLLFSDNYRSKNALLKKL